MPEMEVELKESLTRREVAARLEALAKSLKSGPESEFEYGPATVKLKVPDRIDLSLELEVEEDEVELEIELKWSDAPAAKPSGGRSKTSAK